MDCIERMISDARYELRTLSPTEDLKEDFRLVEEYLRLAEKHYCKLKHCPRKYKKRTWYTPPAL